MSSTNVVDPYVTAAAGNPGGAVDQSPSPHSKRQRKRKVEDFQVFYDEKPKPRKPKEKKTAEEEFDTVWICSECKEAECMMKSEADQLVVCDGACRRLFHYPCAGLSALPGEDEEFTCSDCEQRRHRCSICQDYGGDDVDVFQCSKNPCGLFFHEACLAMYEGDGHQIIHPDESGDSNGVTKPKLICPAHCCWTCTQKDLKEQERVSAAKNKLMKGKKPSKKAKGSFECKTEKYIITCIECPTSYHVTCIPPTARFHELALLCHEHASQHKLPDLDTEYSLQSSIEQKADKKFDEFRERRKKARKGAGKNLFFPGLSGDKLTKRESKLFEMIEKDAEVDEVPVSPEYFCLPCDLKNEVHSKPPTYRHLQSLRYNPSNKPTRIPPSGEKCQCVGFCGDDCLNRMLYVECVGDASKDSSNCRVGAQCGNRQIGKRKVATCKPMREQGKGWGLVPINPIMKGDLVQEYIGEVIDTKEKERRLLEWTEEHPNDTNFYVMELSPGWFVDARHEANLSRFINHSCDPNCILLKINVGGYVRNAVFAKRDISPNEFLSYDYRFDTRQGDRFVCRCGARNCRGTMKERANIDDMSKKSKAEVWEAAKAKFERDKKFLTDYYEDASSRRSQVAATVPGADNQVELVSNGVQAKHRKDPLRRQVFLWRNAVKGSNFLARFSRLDHRSSSKTL